MPKLSTYWQNHLRVAFEESAPQLYRPMLQASLAHVVMLAEQGLLPGERARALLGGLRELLSAPDDRLVFDGSVEDVYYLVEQRLAEAAGVQRSELDVQLARSRNDLDAGVFRMVLRENVLEQARLACAAAEVAAAQADRHADVLIVGYTHRRPAQPTTLGHVLAGYAEALLSQAGELLSVYDELNVSPLGSCAFAGTDLPIAPDRLTELLGFRETFTSSYEAVAGAEHLVRTAAVQARILASGARMARTMLDWMTFRWIVTPDSYCQGSSIMPQKKNPVVLEHMCSMAGAAAADLAATVNNVGAAWYEDSNNATTDVQQHLWRAGDRAVRFLTLMHGLLTEITPLEPPAPEEVVATGATTTAVAEALAAAGVPWRGAHSVVGALVRQAPPAEWTTELVAKAITEAGLGEADDAVVEAALAAGLRPQQVLDRPQPGGPGTEAVRRTAQRVTERAGTLTTEFDSRRTELRRAEDALTSAVDAVLAGDRR
ncbi:lyase family protein [Saccharomonospora cyanea]|uniref:argininosuccinate lyase n=1 Tax=Saccharomonospora cyanea NA-134 TaxID=882082 RepID=H5XNM9_9PSEU|nr:lyase family protein [Saccharomonospora cyanea]EHR61090.1 argininosuccinate lyase [Saccharomonospora cyanea NA-134]